MADPTTPDLATLPAPPAPPTPGEVGEPRRRGARWWVVLPVLALIVGGLALAFAVAASRSSNRMCTLAGAIGMPTAASPEAAFDAWWAQEAVTRPGVDRDDFERDGDSWYLDTGDGTSLQVSTGTPLDLEPQGDGAYAVTGVNRCTTWSG